MKPTLLVLAAGMGSRFGGDKQISGVGPNGEYILDYSLYDAWRAGFGQAVLVIRAELEAPLREHFGHRWDGLLDIRFVEQRLTDLPDGFACPEGRVKPWGTGHAVWCARHAVRGPFAVINADDLYGAETFRLLGQYLTRGDQYAMCGFRLDRTLSENGGVSRGICSVDGQGRLRGVVETLDIAPGPDGAITCDDGQGGRRPLTGQEVASMKFWGLPETLFPVLESQLREFLAARGGEMKSEFYIPSVVDRLIREGAAEVQVLETPEQWFGMTYLADVPVVRDHLRRLTDAGVYPWPPVRG